MTAATAYPLAWPPGWPRTKAREKSRFQQTLAKAMKRLDDELRRINAKNVVISSNVTLGTQRPGDPGVAVYFLQGEHQRCVPCDRWQSVEDNVHAIALTLEALRAIDRWGTRGMVDAAFRGFAALAAPTEGWRAVLGFTAADTPSADAVAAAYRVRAQMHHPDKPGGSAERMADLNRAREQALEELRNA